MKKITVKFYKSTSNKEPVKEFLQGLPKKDKVIIGEDIKTIEFGWPIGMPVCRPLGSGLYEVRSTLSSRHETRIIFTIIDHYMLLLHAFIKKTQKTPANELEIARNRKKEVEHEKAKQ